MLAPKQNSNSGHHPVQQKQDRKPFVLQRKGENARADVQAKLKVGKPNDKFENEADSVADTVVNKKADPNVQQAPAPPIQTMKVTSTDLQRMSEADDVQMMSDSESEVQMMEMGTEEEANTQMKSEDDSDVQMMASDDSDVQMMEMGTEEEANTQMKSEDDSDIQAKFKKNKKNKKSDITSDLKSSKGGGQKMDAETQSTMEDGFGTDLSGVNIHTDSTAVGMNQDLGSKAFTNGADIYFNEGQYDPGSKEGQTLLAHELTHTMQQGAVETGKMSRKEKRAARKEEKAAEKEARKEEKAERKAEKQAAKAEKKAAKEEAKIEKAEVKAEAKETKKAEKAKKKEEKKKAKEEKKEEKKKPNPKDDPNFQAVMGNIKKEGNKQKPKDDPNRLGESANEAAVSPDNEADSLAASDQVSDMEETATEAPPKFEKETFIKLLEDRIKGMMLPETLEEADDFDNHNNIDEINEEATGAVQGETAAAAAPVAGPTNKDPQVTEEHKRKEEKLQTAKKGKKPKSVNAKIAVPPKRSSKEMEKPLADDTARLDNKMADNDVTDHQLAISNEPKFEEALDEKQKAKEESGNMAQALRQQEKGVRDQNAQNADAKSKEQMEGMKVLNHSAVKKVTGNQNATSDKDTAERDRVAGEINQIYENTKADVNEILDNLDKKVESDFSDATEDAKEAFEDHVEDRMDAYKDRRYSGPLGWGRWLKDKIMGVPSEVNKFFTEGKAEFNRVMKERIDVIATYVVDDLNSAIQRIESGKLEVKEYVDNLPGNLKKFGKEAAEEIQDKFDELTQSVNDKQDDLVDMLAEEYMAALEEVNERIEEMKAANRGLVDMVMDFIDGVIETIRKLKEMIQNLMSAIMTAIDVIMEDPIGFMETLFDGLAEGFDNFKANIQKHLLGGLLEWLTGSLGPMGIQLPDDIFSLSGVFDLTLQVLGLGWDYIKLKAVRMMGQPMVDMLMTGFEMFKIFAAEGAMGIWKYLKDQFQDIKATVIDAIKEMLITKVIEAGVKWLLSLLIPGAGFIKAIMAIKDIIVFFVESAIMLIPAITEAILALAKGNVKGVAKAMEFGLAKLITLVIGLFAKLIGLSGLTKRVTKIFKKIRKRVDKAITKLLRKAKKAGRKLMRKLGIGKKKKKGKDERSKKEMEADLKAAKTEATKYLKAPDADPEDLKKKKLPQIKQKYDLDEVKLVHEKDDKYHIHLKVNPQTDTQSDNLEGETHDGYLLDSGSAIHNTEMTIAESRNDKAAVGYKAKRKGSSAKFDGIIIGIKNSKFVKTRNEKGDWLKMFNTLKDKGYADRKKIIQSGAPPHDKFTPVERGEPVVSGNKTTVSYGYKEGDATFEVTYNNETDEPESVSAKNLSYHSLGSGKKEGATKPGMDRAHIIANEVQGSGYKKGHNLMLTSSIFNQKTMRSTEMAIGKYIKGFNIEDVKEVKNFDIDVEVIRFEKGEESLNPNVRLQMKNRLNTLKSKVDGMDEEKKATSKTYAEYSTLDALLKLSNEQIMQKINYAVERDGERRVKDVVYVVKKIKFTNGGKSEPKKVFKTGPDVYGT